MHGANEDSEAINHFITVGSEIAGGATGAAVGLLVAGPAGAVVGAAAGPLATHSLRRLATEFKQRVLGQREEIRIGATLVFAATKVQENLSQGKQIRKDDFFDEQPEDRSTADELVEATLLAAQREHEERKLRFLGNLVGNLPFRPEVDRAQANQLIRLVERMSYRQMKMLALLVQMDDLKVTREGRMYSDYPGFHEMSVIQELYDLFQQGILHRPTDFPADVYTRSPHRQIDVSELGLKLHELMGLNTIGPDELRRLAEVIWA